ncbi:unnamed protein product [Angiostrongylus costaricensis]|uniref:Uncharacterized protein n=1 Tax=Angiostrongylus costaricensis TaxID=334426 RepID=A0A0R3PRM9_ANGCS|nr:unnamed protein product [Angiostrongylus costaricensis]
MSRIGVEGGAAGRRPIGGRSAALTCCGRPRAAATRPSRAVVVVAAAAAASRTHSVELGGRIAELPPQVASLLPQCVHLFWRFSVLITFALLFHSTASHRSTESGMSWRFSRTTS